MRLGHDIYACKISYPPHSAPQVSKVYNQKEKIQSKKLQAGSQLLSDDPFPKDLPTQTPVSIPPLAHVPPPAQAPRSSSL